MIQKQENSPAEKKDNLSDIFVVYTGGKAVGFVQLYKLYHYIKLTKQYLLSDLFVHPEYRGYGLSVALIDQSSAQQFFAGNQLAQIILAINQINFWNRIAISTRMFHRPSAK